MGTCNQSVKVVPSSMKGGEIYRVRIPAKKNNVIYPLSSFDVKVELRLDGEGGELLATWTDADPQITFDDSLGEAILTLEPEETLALTNNPLFDRAAFLDFLFTKPGEGLRSGTIQVNPYKGITV